MDSAIALGLIGLFIGMLRAPRFYAPFLAVLALEVLVVGSISFWDGINSFGARYLLSLTPMAAVGMMTLWAASPAWMRTGLTCAALASCIFVGLFAVEFGLYLIPTHTPLTFSEYNGSSTPRPTPPA